MEGRPPVERMGDEEVLATFGTAAGAAERGYDEATAARVYAYELVRSRGRLALLRALYTAFLGVGKPYMVENLDEAGEGRAVPAKLVFTDDAAEAARLAPAVAVWTEPELLAALSRERSVHDFLAQLLDELEPAVAAQPAPG